MRSGATGKDGKSWAVTPSLFSRRSANAKAAKFVFQALVALSYSTNTFSGDMNRPIRPLAAAGVASVLVPFAYAVDDHQTRNAEYLADAGAAIILSQSSITPS